MQWRRMQSMKSNLFLIIISAIFLFAIIIFGSFSLNIYNKDFYLKEYQKNDVYSTISPNMSYSKEYTADITDNLFGYFRGSSELRYFDENERSHLKDVKFVISGINFIYYSSAIFFIIVFVILYLLSKKDKSGFIDHLSKIILYSSIASLAFLIILFVWTVFSFETLFYLMHAILFPQGNWIFPQGSLLITLFPEQFFFDISLRIFVYAIFQSIVFLIIGLWLRKQVNLFRKFKKWRNIYKHSITRCTIQAF